ncbi:MAG: ParA family protein [Chloroflexi bacterium]|nr:ParA family protein [Chloroflexota bacterium]OJV99156.1 MAG: hypothetical protein BGO39_17015 [Chloroflexi bacterium 54-19]
MGEAVVIGLCNQKGGATKTTTVASLATVFAERGQRVLAIDNDPQGHLSLQFGIDARRDKLAVTVSQLYLQERPTAEAVIHTNHNGVDLIPAFIGLAAVEMNLPGMQASDLRLRLALDEVRRDYDLIFLDSPPNLGKLASNVLAASDYFLVPVDGPWALESVDTLIAVARDNAKFYRLDNQFLGLFLTMTDRTRVMQAVREEAEERWPSQVFRTGIRRSTLAREAAAAREPLPLYAVDSAVAGDYQALADEVTERIGLTKQARSSHGS